MATISDIQGALAGIQERFRGSGGAVDWQAAMPELAGYVRANRLDPSLVAQAATNLSGNKWDSMKVNQALTQFPGTGYGLSSAMNTLGAGGSEARDLIGGTQGRVSDLFSQGLGFLKPYTQTGESANQLQAALSGALGPQAQQEAYAGFSASPGQQWLLEQGERALTRNAAALGGLGGGNVRQELVRFGQGAAAQDFGNAFQRLGQVGDRGFAASTQAAEFGPREAAIQANLGQFAAGIPMQTAGQQAQLQFQTGRDISQNVGQTSSALANLMQQQGAGQADIIGGAAQNFANLYQQAAQGDANAREQLGSMLANLGMTGAGQFTGVPNTPIANTNYLGQVGQLASGVGGLLAGVGGGQGTGTGTPQIPSGGGTISTGGATTQFNPNYQLPAFAPQPAFSLRQFS